MYIYQFKRHYNLDLIYASHADISLADLVWKRKHKSPLLSRKGMPHNVYNSFLMEGLINQKEWSEAINAFENNEFQEAQFGSLQVETNRTFGFSFAHPAISLLHSDATLAPKVRFSFGKLQVQPMSNFWRIEIERLLKKGGSTFEKKALKRLRKVHLITELYYGNIRCKIDRNLTQKLERMLVLHPNEAPLLTYQDRNFKVYEFAHQEVPFAMRVEALKGFRS
jgi:hypothetical protein